MGNAVPGPRHGQLSTLGTTHLTNMQPTSEFSVDVECEQLKTQEMCEMCFCVRGGRDDLECDAICIDQEWEES